MIYATTIFLFCILADQATKLLALNNSYVLNHGLALNIGQSLPTYWLILFIISIVMLVSGINIKYWKKNKKFCNKNKTINKYFLKWQINILK